MRRPRSRSFEDLDTVDVLIGEDQDTLDVLLDEDKAADEVHDVLHVLALEAMARRARSPGDERPWLLAGVWEDVPDEGAQEAVPEDDGQRGGRLRRAVARHPARWGVAALVVLALVVAANVVDARRTAARVELLATHAAVLSPRAEPPVELWRRPGRAVVVNPEHLLVVDRESLQALDPATGEEVWRTSSTAREVAARGRCFPLDEGLRPDRLPTTAADGPAGLVACVANQVAGGAGLTRVVVLDAATGQVRLQAALGGYPILAQPAARDLLLVLALPGGSIRAVRWDLTTAQPRWDVTREGARQGTGRWPAAERRTGSLTVGPVGVDLLTGDAVPEEDARREPVRYDEQRLPDGSVARWSWRPDGRPGQGRVSGEDLWRAYSIPGPALVPDVSDGTQGRILVVRTSNGDRVRGLDARTGARRWSEPFPGGEAPRAVALVQGVLLVEDGARVTALDVRTGERLWRSDVAPGPGRPVVTDGDAALLPVRDTEGGLHVLARRVTDGAEVWRARLPEGAVGLEVVQHRLIVATDGAVVGLG